MLVPGVASAHIHMLTPLSRTDDAQGDPQKTMHCGVPGYVRADHPQRVTTFRPGQTVRVMWKETIAHTGWYRISFQPNGEVFAYPPPGVGTVGNHPTVNQTGITDGSGATVLLDRIPDGAPGVMQMADITLPNRECNNCTLQFTQFMTDSAYNPVNAGSVYFSCADIVLSNTAPTTPDAGPIAGADAGVDAGAPATGGEGVKGGCSTGGSTGLGTLAMFGLLGLRRRRRATHTV
jgi:uncharacterized protein (TIGR03382 family)